RLRSVFPRWGGFRVGTAMGFVRGASEVIDTGHILMMAEVASIGDAAQRGPAAGSVGEQVAEVGGWVGQEAAPGADDVQFLPLGRAHAPVTELQDGRAGECSNDGRMGGDDRLGACLGEVMEEGDQPQAGSERQWSVGFVHEIEAWLVHPGAQY